MNLAFIMVLVICYPGKGFMHARNTKIMSAKLYIMLNTSDFNQLFNKRQVLSNEKVWGLAQMRNFVEGLQSHDKNQT